ncbi:AMP binding protein [Amanita rubescens]|nr:AMP binding protein [Amanita rubescens]
MTSGIYNSPIPSVPIVRRSVYTHLFASSDPNLVGQFPGSVSAFIDPVSGMTITRAHLKRLTLAFGYGICNHPQIAAKRGDVVLIYSINSLCWPVVLLGSVAAGLRCTFPNSAYNAQELATHYVDSGAALILTSEDGLATAQATLQNLGLTKDQVNKRIIVLGSSLRWLDGPAASRKPEAAGLVHMEDLLKLGTLEEEVKFDGELAHETVYLCYSSGTSGKPKGVETTHQNVTANLDSLIPVFPPVTAGELTLGILPFYYIYGLMMNLHFPFMCGTPVIIQQLFEPAQFCANVEKYKVTIALTVPPVLLHLARHSAVDEYNMSSLEYIIFGAAPLGDILAIEARNRLLSKRSGKSKLSLLQGYGLTEASCISHLTPVPEDMDNLKISSVGVLLPNLEARIVVADKGGLDAGEGQPGELWMRGPTIMKAYLGDKAATTEAFTSDGWFKTGDVAKRDVDGFYYIVDRRKELIKYKVIDIAPAELESILLAHPNIKDAAVIAVQSTKEATELPRAYVVPKPNAVRDIPAFCRDVEDWTNEKIAWYKHLRGGVVIIDIIPKSVSGKILRRELRERAKREIEGHDSADWRGKTCATLDIVLPSPVGAWGQGASDS